MSHWYIAIISSYQNLILASLAGFLAPQCRFTEVTEIYYSLENNGELGQRQRLHELGFGRHSRSAK